MGCHRGLPGRLGAGSGRGSPRHTLGAQGRPSSKAWGRRWSPACPSLHARCSHDGDLPGAPARTGGSFSSPGLLNKQAGPGALCHLPGWEVRAVSLVLGRRAASRVQGTLRSGEPACLDRGPPGVDPVPAPASSATTTGPSGTQTPAPNPQSPGALVCGPRKVGLLFAEGPQQVPQGSGGHDQVPGLAGTLRTDRTRVWWAGAQAGGGWEGCLEEGAKGKGWQGGRGCCPTGPALVLAWSSPQGSPDSWPFWGQQWPAFKFQLSRPEWPAGVRTGAPTPSPSPARHIPASPEVASRLPGGRECGAQWPGTRAH